MTSDYEVGHRIGYEKALIDILKKEVKAEIQDDKTKEFTSESFVIESKHVRQMLDGLMRKKAEDH